MTSIELDDKITKLLAVLTAKDIWVHIAKWATFFETIRDDVFYGLRDAATNQAMLNGLRGRITKFFPELRAPKTSVIMADIRAVETALRDFYGVGDAPENDYAVKIGNAVILADVLELDRFNEVYEAFLKGPDVATAALLLDAANRTYVWYEDFTLRLQFIQTRLMPRTPLEDDGTSISLLFDGPFDVDGIIDALSSLRDLYAEVLKTFGQTGSLAIAKVESGSLFLRLVGVSPAIAFMTKILSGFVRPFTMDGRLSAVDRQLNLLPKFQATLKDLKEDGADVTIAEKQLGVCAADLVKAFDEVIQFRPRLVIDGKPTAPMETNAVKTLSGTVQPPPKQLE